MKYLLGLVATGAIVYNYREHRRIKKTLLQTMIEAVPVKVIGRAVRFCFYCQNNHVRIFK